MKKRQQRSRGRRAQLAKLKEKWPAGARGGRHWECGSRAHAAAHAAQSRPATPGAVRPRPTRQARQVEREGEDRRRGPSNTSEHNSTFPTTLHKLKSRDKMHNLLKTRRKRKSGSFKALRKEFRAPNLNLPHTKTPGPEDVLAEFHCPLREKHQQQKESFLTHFTQPGTPGHQNLVWTL